MRRYHVQAQGQVQAASALRYAGVGRRFLATLIDVVILGVIEWIYISLYIFIAIAFGGFQVQKRWAENPLPTDIGLLIGFLLIPVFYYIVLEAVIGGTLGKMLLGIRVVTVDRSPIGWGAC